MQVIHRCLKPGGYWLNAGPLLYHWSSESDITGFVPSLELSLEVLQSAARSIGFELVKEDRSEAVYIGDTQGLFSTTYTSARWVMQKRVSASELVSV